MPPLRFRSLLARGGMFVPSDSFGGQSPEKKAAGILRTFFTFVAARVVLAQLEGSGRGALGAYDSQAATDLHHFLQDVPMRDGDDWLEQLTRQNSSLGLRLMEVRDSYCDEAFEWDQLQRLAKQDMKGANTKLMRRFATASLAASLEQGDGEGGGGGLPGSARADWRSAAGGGGGGGSSTVDATAQNGSEAAAVSAPANDGGSNDPNAAASASASASSAEGPANGGPGGVEAAAAAAVKVDGAAPADKDASAITGSIAPPTPTPPPSPPSPRADGPSGTDGCQGPPPS